LHALSTIIAILLTGISVLEQNTHLIAVEEKIKAQKQTLWSILDKAKAGLVAILEL
jgi:hypothetical protein